MTDWRLENGLFLLLLGHRGADALGGADVSRLAKLLQRIQPRIDVDIGERKRRMSRGGG